MLAKRPEDRYQTPGELLAVLKKIHAEAADEQAAAANPPHGGQAQASRAAEAVPPPSSSSEQVMVPEAPEPEPAEPESPAAPAADAPTVADGSSTNLSAEQVKAAAAQYQRARQVLVEGGNDDYARQLLLACLKLDLGNLHARKALRELNQKGGGSFLGRWMGSLSNLANKGKVKAARAAGDHRKVLECGEDVLARRPDDVATALDMTASAQALGLTDLAAWLLEQACAQAPGNTAPARALAQLYEERKQLKQAIALWEAIRKADPSDQEAKQKINDLAATDHITRARYRR
jgi:tetratricopeptide (TPR) repeat protein